MAFKKNKQPQTSVDTPEALLHDLRKKKIKGPIAHQADMWRNYLDGAIDDPDVALQLPTGSGKTLVGLILGEWRRRKFSERVVYLCPTNQLVNQVVDQANNKYGLNVHAFTGPISKYDSNAKSAYLCSEAIAVTSYSALFNTNPFFDNANIIIVDDAHSSENYISKLWSLEIERFNDDSKALFIALSSSFKDHISVSDYHKLTTDEDNIYDRAWVEKIPSPVFFNLIPTLIPLIDEYSRGNQLSYQWQMIRDNLHACHCYISQSEILIRPLIPPSDTHLPFSKATQRIYMSATLGQGGDLERLTGRSNIKRLPIPAGWDHQGIGRRFFLFPERALTQELVDDLQIELCKLAGRAMALVPSERRATVVSERVARSLSFPTFDAREIEQSKSPFLRMEKAVAVIANRFDGIDFPEDECRLLFVEDLPATTNIQERFLFSRMGAAVLLNDRIMTRIIQAFGRCTRSSTDYSAVVVSGEDLLSFLFDIERRQLLHPELQAELQFGMDESKENTVEEFIENVGLFLEQGEEWLSADSEIVSLRNSSVQKSLSCLSNLSEAVSHELSYQYKLWQGDYVGALNECTSVVSKLTDTKLRGYRSLWNYLAGSAAKLASRSGSSYEEIARGHFESAMKGAQSIRWLVGLSIFSENNQTNDNDEDVYLPAVVERFECFLESLGVSNTRKYDRLERDIIEKINSSDSALFEEGQVQFGKILGFDAGNKETSGAPDPWWIVSENLCFIFEDHSEAESSSNLSVTKARQAFTHPNWARENLPLADNAKVLSVLVTPVMKADTDALPHLKNVFLWNLENYRKWVREALSIVRSLRATYPGAGNLFWRDSVSSRYLEAKINPNSIVEMLEKSPAANELS